MSYRVGLERASASIITHFHMHLLQTHSSFHPHLFLILRNAVGRTINILFPQAYFQDSHVIFPKPNPTQKSPLRDNKAPNPSLTQPFQHIKIHYLQILDLGENPQQMDPPTHPPTYTQTHTYNLKPQNSKTGRTPQILLHANPSNQNPKPNTPHSTQPSQITLPKRPGRRLKGAPKSPTPQQGPTKRGLS